MMIIRIVLIAFLLLSSASAHAESINIAAAADLKFAMDEIISGFNREHTGNQIQATYGSSGRFQTQIRQGAPYDMFFSADIAFPRELAKSGLAASEVRSYGLGRIVLWSSSMNAARMTLTSLNDPKIEKIAIANPKHAPYGKRAEEALRAVALWEKLQQKLVYGENISQTAQYVQSGNAQIGIIALSLALGPELSKKGGYYLIPENLHAPLEQGYIITRRGADKPLVKNFAQYLESKKARSIMARYGFKLPDDQSVK